MPAKLSVIVPFFNVEDYLEECLESLARQTLCDLQVVMVDDGSPDGSTVIAKAYAERDERFVLVQQDNAGLGPARNTGVRHATGEYLAFADSDDVLPRFAYELLTGTLDETGSDIACGNVNRFSSSRVWQCWAHREPFATKELGTHVSRRPNLMQDRMVWNKVFRRSFWDRAGLEFPGILYEDAPVMVRAHVLAESVDVLSRHVYYWRERTGSITQRKAELANLVDRMASVHAVRVFLDEHAPGLNPAYDSYALQVDLGVLTEALPKLPPEEQVLAVELGRAYLSGVDRQVLRDLPAAKRLRFHLLEQAMLPELLEALAFEKTEQAGLRIVRKGLLRPRFYAAYPYFQDGSRAVPDEIYEVTDQLRLWAFVDGTRWVDGRLRIEGRAHFSRLDAGTPHSSKIKLWLAEPESGRRVALDVERTCRPEVTAGSGQWAASYDWSGFAATIDPADLRIDGSWKTTTWELHAEVANSGLKRSVPVGGAHRPGVKWQTGRSPAEHVWVQPSVGEHFVLQVQRPKAVLGGHRSDGGELELRGWTSVDPGPEPGFAASRMNGRPAVTGSAEFTSRAGGWEFTARLPLDQLVSDSDAEDRAVRPAQVNDGIDWDLRLLAGGRRVRIAMPYDLAEGRYAVGDDLEFALTRTRFGNLRGVERARRLVVDDVHWGRGEDGTDRLVMRGSHCGPTGQRPDRLLLSRHRSGEQHEIPLVWADDRFTAEIATGAMPRFGETAPLASGVWELRLADPRTGACGLVTVVGERRILADLPQLHTVGHHVVFVETHQYDSLRLRVRVALDDEVRGAHGQRRIRDVGYPALLRQPVEELAVFDCYEGAQYSCNPRAIYEELRSRDTGLDYLWVSRDGQFAAPDGGRVALVGSREHYEALARARYLVGNYGQFHWFRKRPEQTYLQTWHGTPLKKLAYDLREMPYQRTETLGWMEREVPHWDVLLSPNPFSTPIFRRAFGYEGEILESGYPRNDVLKAPGAAQTAARVRERLGIPAGRKVVLYAPTWRDDHHIATGKRAFTLELDVAAARRALGEDHVLLVRTHYLVTDRSWSSAGGFVIDVSRYPDIAELYLAADVLVTDYSSAMFDFAVTGKPMVFFTYDLERYRDQVRGFYFDFEAEAPGPLVRTTAELAEAVRAAGGTTGEHAAAHAAFTRKFCPYDDGRAAARVVDHVFTGHSGKGSAS